MNYEFSLNKSALVSLVLGSVLISVLLFSSGLIVGSQWLSTSAAAADATAKNDGPQLPKEPVLNDEKAPPPKSAPAPVKTTASAAPQAPAPAAAVSQGATVSAAVAAAAPPAANGEVTIISEAAADPNDENAGEPEYVTVQIGVFLDEQEASRLLKDVERKGYAPSFFSGRDAEARQWYAVRIGAYSDKQQAANAAANFMKQERIKATVRPLGSL
jgi:hypothetical protein